MLTVGEKVYQYNDLRNHMELAKQWSGAIQHGRNMDLGLLSGFVEEMQVVNEAMVAQGLTTLGEGRLYIDQAAYAGRLAQIAQSVAVAMSKRQVMRQMQFPELKKAK